MYILLYTLHSYVYVLLSRLHTNDAVFVCSTILSNKHYDVMYFMHQTYTMCPVYLCNCEPQGYRNVCVSGEGSEAWRGIAVAQGAFTQ